MDETRAGVQGDSQAPPRGPAAPRPSSAAALLCSSLDRSDFGLGHDSCDSSPGGERRKGPLWSPRCPEAGASLGQHRPPVAAAPRGAGPAPALLALRSGPSSDPETVRPGAGGGAAFWVKPLQRVELFVQLPGETARSAFGDPSPGEPFHRAGRGPRPFPSESLGWLPAFPSPRDRCILKIDANICRFPFIPGAARRFLASRGRPSPQSVPRQPGPTLAGLDRETDLREVGLSLWWPPGWSLPPLFLPIEPVSTQQQAEPREQRVGPGVGGLLGVQTPKRKGLRESEEEVSALFFSSGGGGGWRGTGVEGALEQCLEGTRGDAEKPLKEEGEAWTEASGADNLSPVQPSSSQARAAAVAQAGVGRDCSTPHRQASSKSGSSGEDSPVS
ncbi:unnamed protein product [Rangifer tarandus platyrhynchus]|uniref:Uncharacterized protein n=1 Tax=Rangifer tarandus platyrhynchus TaxID=3082113 RepID=A0AC59YXP5_RANTA